MESSFEAESLNKETGDLSGVEKIDALNEISSRIVNKRPDKSLILANEALRLSKTIDYSLGYIKALMNLASCYKFLGKPEDALPLLIQALDKSREIENNEKTASLCNKIALIYKITGDYASSADYYFKALSVAESFSDEELKGNVLNNLANLYLAWEKFEKAEEYHLKLLAIREKNGPSEELAHTLNNLGNLYFKMKEYEKSLELNNRALAIKQTFGDKLSISTTLSNIGNIHLELYSENNDRRHLESAKEILREALKIRKESNNISGLASAHVDIARLHIAMNEFRGATANLEKSMKIASEGNLRTILLTVYQEFSRVYEAAGDYFNALKYNKMYYELKDKLFSEESNIKILELQSKYEKEKIEKQNEIYRLKIEANENLESIVEQRTEELKKEIQRRIKSEEEILKFKTLTDEAAYGAAISDSTGKIIYVNNSLLNMLGYSNEELLGKNLSIFKPPGSDVTPEKIISLLTLSKTAIPAEVIATRKDGTKFSALINPGLIKDSQGKPLYLQSSFIDITERKKVEFQLRQNQKMHAIGTMASGIAHDFNNILGSISTFAELAKSDIPVGSPAVPQIENISAAIAKAKDFVREILTFSKDKEKELKPIMISKFVKESAELLKKSVPGSIDVKIDTDPLEDLVLGDPSQIHQILLNLFTNARYAMRDNGGIIELRLKKKDNRIILTFLDTGEGIEQSSLDRIFEPYYTTKKDGEGSGIGLAIVHGLVKKSNGEITVNSEIGKGTVFEISFPVLEKKPEKESSATTTVKTGEESILYVDDEALFVETMEVILRRLGYNIRAVSDAKEALSIFSENPSSFDLVIADYTMPGISGPEMVQKMRELHPDVPVIFCSGFLNADIQETIKHIPNAKVMTKPVPVSELAAMIREVLDKNVSIDRIKS
ncbi:tetratricopeptide repeat protein [candidate division WOR-3 bacterium]|nr:tetratricopeptide repeat protein [candidate division WOR-3 bacterium]